MRGRREKEGRQFQFQRGVFHGANDTETNNEQQRGKKRRAVESEVTGEKENIEKQYWRDGRESQQYSAKSWRISCVI